MSARSAWLTRAALMVYCLWSVLLIVANPGLNYDEALLALGAVQMRHSHQEIALPHDPNTWVCVHGRCAVVADDGVHRQEFILDAPNLAVYLPPMTWAVEYQYSPDAVLLVLSSGAYDAADYIRDYAEFLALKRPSVG